MNEACLGKMRSEALDIFGAGLEAADPARAVKQNIQRAKDILTAGEKKYRLSSFDRISVIGAGKASAAMAKAVEECLQDRITNGWINVKYGHSLVLGRITVHEAGHPVPDKAGLEGSLQILEIAKNAGERDLLIALLSGGGSALLLHPAAGLSLEDKKATTQTLLKSGADISEMNAIRKHLSSVKGGQLARLAFPATVIALILSDVIGDQLSNIASGPFYPDESTFFECRKILSKYGIENQIPSRVLKHIEDGALGKKKETLKSDDPIFRKVNHIVVGNNFRSIEAAKKKAAELGYHSLILSSLIEGETREIAKMHSAIAKEIFQTGNPLPRPACIISGGETTVRVKGKGLGGRNQEFVLAAALMLGNQKKVVILSCGTDGTDGPTDAAGAIADGLTLNRARRLGLDPELFLANNDSYHFFKALDDLIITGPTLTNVMDIRIILVK